MKPLLTKEMDSYFKPIYAEYPLLVATDMLNNKFGTNFTNKQLGDYAKRRKYPYSNYTGIIVLNGEEHKYINGQHQPNHREVGYERREHRGKLIVNLGDGNWTRKDRYIWEQAYGKIPDGYDVWELDRNVDNFDLNNLVLMNRGQRRAYKMYYPDNLTVDEARVAINITKLVLKIKEITHNDRISLPKLLG